MNSKTISVVLSVITVISVLAAAFMYLSYGNQITTLNDQVNTLQQTVNDQTTQLNAYHNLTLVDDEGYVTTLTAIPTRIASLAPSNTQMLFAVGAGPKVVGMTDFDDYPYDFQSWISVYHNMTSVGGYGTVNKEAITTLNPDLILATTMNDQDTPALRELGYKVLTIDPSSVNGVLQDILLVGRATGNDAKSALVINDINTKLNAIATKVGSLNQTKPNVYYEIWSDPLQSVGATSWVTDVINRAGGNNIFANVTEAWPTVSSETVVSLNPDVIILPTTMGTGGAFKATLDQVKTRPGWDVTNAFKNDRLYVIDQDTFAIFGPRIAEQVQTIAACLYPNDFSMPASPTQTPTPSATP
jgi:iron complex transport system substrate-binding protein